MGPSTSDQLDELRERVRRLEDREAIRHLLMAYKRHLDQRDLRAYAALFTDNGEWIGSLGKMVGPDQIEQLLSETLEVWDDDRERTYHLAFDPVIDVDGDVATAVSSWCYVTRDAHDAPVLSMLGRYHDRLERTDDGWRFARRVAYCDVPYLDIADVGRATAPYIPPNES